MVCRAVRRMGRLACVFMLGCVLDAAAGTAGDPVAVIEKSFASIQRTVMDNGMTCLIKEDHSAPVVSVQIWIRTGSIHEDWRLGGGDPLSSLASWVIVSGEDSGALSSPYSSGGADLFATFQGHWGITQFPLSSRPVVPVDTPEISAETENLVPVFAG